MPDVADFRSDTVTRPTPAMREAMAGAVVGDDVLGDDPTVKELEREVANLLGKEAALFVPTGSQGNQIAAHLHARPGQEIAVGENAHTYDWEMAGLAAISGLQARTLPAEKGRIDLEAARGALRPAGGHRPACLLLTTENTHNFHGGAVVPLEHLQELREIAIERGAKVHLDGARLWNAAAASGVALADYAATADSVMTCLSKALGAPVGSVLSGDADFIAEAHDVRKMLGGGMRQVGVLAAPGLVAVRDQRERLVEDHERAAKLAEGFLRVADVELPYGLPETNIVFVRAVGRDANALVSALERAGVLTFATGPDTLRFVTHYDVNDHHVDRCLEAFNAACSSN
ncbi:MAG: GntG family PLP-dependent aldolase [Planctomycetota bacterium]|nr:GntG family PLP-dependent aldolase [Planctomycetota bacterium]